MTDPKPDHVFMNNAFGKRVLCTIGMHFTRQIETGELYCDRCDTIVADEWNYPWYGWVGLGLSNLAFFVVAAWMYSRGDAYFALLMLAIGVMFASDTISVYYRQQGENV